MCKYEVFIFILIDETSNVVFVFLPLFGGVKVCSLKENCASLIVSSSSCQLVLFPNIFRFCQKTFTILFSPVTLPVLASVKVKVSVKVSSLKQHQFGRLVVRQYIFGLFFGVLFAVLWSCFTCIGQYRCALNNRTLDSFLNCWLFQMVCILKPVTLFRFVIVRLFHEGTCQNQLS